MNAPNSFRPSKRELISPAWSRRFSGMDQDIVLRTIKLLGERGGAERGLMMREACQYVNRSLSDQILAV